jgi:aspartyl-tRNA(Asn)/glutamyl-tRNA(Gln) amidotransferase subunit C
MSTIDPATVMKIADLARLAVNERERAGFAAEMSAILQLVERMTAVDTASVDPLAHPLDEFQPQRDDEVTEPNQRELFQSIAPSVADGLYLVPKVIE